MTGRRFRPPRLLAALVALVALSACGGEGSTSAGSGSSDTIPTIPRSPTTTPSAEPRAAARWETVVTLNGSGTTTTEPFEILPGAIQWRVRWECETGELRVESDPPPRRPAPLADTACPAEGEGYSIVTGTVRLAVTASGPWKLIVDQQVDTPLNEPPLPAMATGEVLRQGNFYDVEKTGRGTARLYQLPQGGHAVRFEDLYVNENTDLFVWLSTAANPQTSKEAVDSQYWVLGNLKSTIGSQNYTIPSDIPVDRVRSIVIWCEPVAIAYAAAALS